MIYLTISHCKIVEKIREGGMNVVYKTEDTTLKRFVALKFPSAQVLTDEGKKARFIQKARTSAALDHPNICPLHEIDQAEGKTSYHVSLLI
jgi:serine/threonine protein kinase